MRKPGHAVNGAIDTTSTVLPEISGVDLAATVARVVGWGGDAGLYVHFLSSATRETARPLATVAGWRAGVIGLRDAALEAAAGLGPAAAAGLGLDADQLSGFLDSQASDPFAWPDGSKPVATIGGFIGLGGPWLAPPTRPVVTGSATFRVTSGVDTWQIEADVFGSHLTLLPDEERAARPIPHSPVLASVSPDSYLVTLARV
jgi:hypothetical protein